MLALLLVFIIVITVYCIFTNDNTPEDRDEMLNSEEMFP